MVMSIFKRVRTLGFFSLAALALGLASCDNLGTDDGPSSLAIVHNVTAAEDILETREFNGRVGFQGVLPQEFFNDGSSQENGGRTLFPSTPTSLTYSVSAAQVGGTKTVTGAATSSSFSISIPFTSTTEKWNITLSAKSSSKVVLQAVKQVSYSTTGSSLSMPLDYYSGASTETGGISLTIPISTGTGGSGINSAKVTYNKSGGTASTESATLSGTNVTWSKTSLAPGLYTVKIVFYSGTSGAGNIVYVINETAMVYSNLTTSVPYGHADYIASTGSGFATITDTVVKKQNNVVDSGKVYVGGTGVSGVTANDSNSGSAFAPVKTLYRALAIVNDMATTNPSKEYIVQVQDDIDAGTTANKKATVNSGVKVKILGDNTTSWRKIGGGSTAGTYNITSNGTVTVGYLKFDKLSNIQVAAGTLTIDNSSVTNATNGGFSVSTGAMLKSTEGLTISACSRSSGGGGIVSVGTLTLTGTEISGCKATTDVASTYSGCGGALLVAGATTLTSCTIGVASPSTTASSQTACSNYAANMGGGIYIYGGATVTLGSSTKVQYNYAGGTSGSGGGIYINNGTLALTGGTTPATIGFNGAATDGGGLYISSSCAKAIELKGLFYKNSAAGNGGAIYTASGAAVTTPTSDGPVIGANILGLFNYGNSASNGGGIYIASTGVSFADAVISYNTATYGAGVYISSSGGAAFANGGSITNCSASSSGGGIYVNGGSVTLTGGTISCNTVTASSSGKGGGIFNSGGTVFISGSAVIGGSSSDDGNKVTSTSGGMGGGIYNSGALYLGYSDASTPADWDGSISANSVTKGNGGGVYVASGDSCIFKMARGTIGGATDAYANTATLGGAIYNSSTVLINIGDSASVPPGPSCKNDIYLNTVTGIITLTSNLTADAPVGLITIPSNTSESAITSGRNIMWSTAVVVTDYINSSGKFGLRQNLKWQLIKGVSTSVSEAYTKAKKADGYVSVTGATVGEISGSNVFVTGRSVVIPSMVVSDHELTQKEYQQYCYYSSSTKYPGGPYSWTIASVAYNTLAGDNYPAFLVSWYDAIVYCNLRSMAEGLNPVYSLGGETDPSKWSGIVKGTGTNAGKYCGPVGNNANWNGITFDRTASANGWRMPTEAEWEYLARGGNTTSAGYTYSGSDAWTSVAWTYDNIPSKRASEVKQKTANGLSIYDMSGNVFEYVWDWYGGTITSSTPATGAASPTPVDIGGVSYNRRMVRGGGMGYDYTYAKVSDRRVNNNPQDRWENSGVRVVRNAP